MSVENGLSFSDLLRMVKQRKIELDGIYGPRARYGSGTEGFGGLKGTPTWGDPLGGWNSIHEAVSDVRVTLQTKKGKFS